MPLKAAAMTASIVATTLELGNNTSIVDINSQLVTIKQLQEIVN